MKVNDFLMLRAAAVAPTSIAVPTVKPPQLPKSPQQTTPTRRVARSLPPTAETARLAMEASVAARVSLRCCVYICLFQITEKLDVIGDEQLRSTATTTNHDLTNGKRID